MSDSEHEYETEVYKTINGTRYYISDIREAWRTNKDYHRPHCIHYENIYDKITACIYFANNIRSMMYDHDGIELDEEGMRLLHVGIDLKYTTEIKGFVIDYTYKRLYSLNKRITKHCRNLPVG